MAKNDCKTAAKSLDSRSHVKTTRSSSTNKTANPNLREIRRDYYGGKARTEKKKGRGEPVPPEDRNREVRSKVREGQRVRDEETKNSRGMPTFRKCR